MMKTLITLLAACALCACAGTPPAWWNPTGAYGPVEPAAAPSLPAPVSPEEEEPIPMEQSIEPAVEGYEEMILSPLPQSAQDNPMQPTPAEDLSGVPASAAAPAQPTPSPEAPASPAATPTPERRAESAAPAENSASLPPPSVLD